MVRRAAAAGIGLLVVLLLVFGINGCLNGRQEQALKDYNRDVSSLVQDADANADDFFDVLSGATTSGDAASTDVQSEINQLRSPRPGAHEARRGLGVPGDMRPAHVNLLLSLALVQEAIGKVAEKIPAALSTDSATAVPAVARDRRRDARLRRRRRRLQPPHRGAHQAGARRQRHRRPDDPELELPAEPRLDAALDGRQRINSQAGRGAGDGGVDRAARRARTATACSRVSVGDTTLAPGQANRLTARRT